MARFGANTVRFDGARQGSYSLRSDLGGAGFGSVRYNKVRSGKVMIMWCSLAGLGTVWCVRGLARFMFISARARFGTVRFCSVCFGVVRFIIISWSGSLWCGTVH